MTEPASTPNSGGCPSSCRQNRAHDVLEYRDQRREPKKIRTSGPPTRSSERLAPKPIVVKNAIISGVCSVVSKLTSVTPRARGRTQHDRDEQTADDGRRDVVAREHWHAAPNAVADEEDDAGERDGLDQIER